ncbi:glycosyltransferase family 4 protein [Halomonas sp. MA07-2]|uniref:glycosyltransferase family 4 protein n=1 Tax=unclassified Halomonas TaxID=2609666 RepID=UPI003EEF9FEF
MKSLAVNACNLHAGGGVQVATSFIHELSLLEESRQVSLFVSTEVDTNLRAMNFEAVRFKSYKVMDVYGLGQLGSPLRKEFNRFDVVFTVFGPLYMIGRRFKSVVGFAQPWIIYPDNEVYAGMETRDRLKTRLQFNLQKLFFTLADDLVVELEHVERKLRELGVKKRIHVVYNCLSKMYLQEYTCEPAHVDFRRLSLGVITRDYPHKNLDILPHVKLLMKNKYNIDAVFNVTLNDDEWNAKSDTFKRCITNVGSLKVTQCPDFYQKLDGVVFPSYLECFSASPLEAMAMKKPLFASDRGFVRDVCGDYALYFDPMDPESIADVIYTYFYDDARATVDLEAARQHAAGFSSSSVRARKYLDIMMST